MTREDFYAVLTDMALSSFVGLGGVVDGADLWVGGELIDDDKIREALLPADHEALGEKVRLLTAEESDFFGAICAVSYLIDSVVSKYESADQVPEWVAKGVNLAYTMNTNLITTLWNLIYAEESLDREVAGSFSLACERDGSVSIRKIERPELIDADIDRILLSGVTEDMNVDGCIYVDGPETMN